MLEKEIEKILVTEVKKLEVRHISLSVPVTAGYRTGL